MLWSGLLFWSFVLQQFPPNSTQEDLTPLRSPLALHRAGFFHQRCSQSSSHHENTRAEDKEKEIPAANHKGAQTGVSRSSQRLGLFIIAALFRFSICLGRKQLHTHYHRWCFQSLHTLIIPNNGVLKSMVTAFVVQLQNKAFQTQWFPSCSFPKEIALKDRGRQLVRN